jgi:hypothetical protein
MNPVSFAKLIKTNLIQINGYSAAAGVTELCDHKKKSKNKKEK